MDVAGVYWPAIERPEAATFAVLDDDGTPLSTATVIPEPCSWRPHDSPAWQLRGMATAPDARGRGAGRLALDAAVDHVRAEGAALVWCHARDVALTFYERAGFTVEGDGFRNDADIPHHPMARPLR